jgi:hypothetical protein
MQEQLSLPDEHALARHVVEALDTVAAGHDQLGNADWFPAIAAELASRCVPLGLSCYATDGRRSAPADGCAGREWLFDFCALVSDEAVAPVDRFMAQAAIVGEVEWGSVFDDDFEKLMIADSLVCFMTIQQWSGASAIIQLSRLSDAAKRRQGYVRQRGGRPPVFVVSCYVIPEHRFEHRVLAGGR